MNTIYGPGWYPDPYRRQQLRWWDGTQWTHHASTNGFALIDDPTEPGGHAPPPSPEPDRLPSSLLHEPVLGPAPLWLFALVFGLTALIVLGAIVLVLV